jgi:hypothetical protein
MSWSEASAGLLDIARLTLRESVQPAIAAERRYEAAMVANAIGIAARALRLGAAAEAAEAADLARFYDTTGDSITSLRARLCRELRAGDIRPESEPSLRAMLWAATRRRLAISNPDHLQRYGG